MTRRTPVIGIQRVCEGLQSQPATLAHSSVITDSLNLAQSSRLDVYRRPFPWRARRSRRRHLPLPPVQCVLDEKRKDGLFREAVNSGPPVMFFFLKQSVALPGFQQGSSVSDVPIPHPREFFRSFQPTGAEVKIRLQHSEFEIKVAVVGSTQVSLSLFNGTHLAIQSSGPGQHFPQLVDDLLLLVDNTLTLLWSQIYSCVVGKCLDRLRIMKNGHIAECFIDFVDHRRGMPQSPALIKVVGGPAESGISRHARHEMPDRFNIRGMGHNLAICRRTSIGKKLLRRHFVHAQKA